MHAAPSSSRLAPVDDASTGSTTRFGSRPASARSAMAVMLVASPSIPVFTAATGMSSRTVVAWATTRAGGRVSVPSCWSPEKRSVRGSSGKASRSTSQDSSYANEIGRCSPRPGQRMSVPTWVGGRSSGESRTTISRSPCAAIIDAWFASAAGAFARRPNGDRPRRRRR